MLYGRRLLLMAIGLILAVFIIFSPTIDQYIAMLPYNESSKVFYGEHTAWCLAIYRAVPYITVLIILVPLIRYFLARNNQLQQKRILRFGLIVYLALILGPGLVVNVIFKDHWGRPRPYQVLRDGKTYSPFWEPHWGNKTDNSFPGGHASIGFFIGVPLLALNRRKKAIKASIAGGIVIGIVRILQGGHYLSDIVFSGIFVWIIAEVVVYAVSKWCKKVEICE